MSCLQWKTETFSNKVKQELENIKYGKIEDRFNWMLKV